MVLRKDFKVANNVVFLILIGRESHSLGSLSAKAWSSLITSLSQLLWKQPAELHSPIEENAQAHT